MISAGSAGSRRMNTSWKCGKQAFLMRCKIRTVCICAAACLQTMRINLRKLAEILDIAPAYMSDIEKADM